MCGLTYREHTYHGAFRLSRPQQQLIGLERKVKKRVASRRLNQERIYCTQMDQRGKPIASGEGRLMHPHLAGTQMWYLIIGACDVDTRTSECEYT